ncbi:YceI family protein [Cytophagaceae bacterium YF14B1]|uniref:YceI family protein n=1 Tax=Xanthocytophaga flava TaxID=3048013 RepID=A0AAE3QNU2_9BACT|nr:YceI family protein [Xanthocytophaga flavus]MDJ1482752.1 YceI family protein [Xanthocytophaga flavus]
MATTKWISDSAHSELQFKIKHLMISTVTGSVKKFEVMVESHGDDFTNAKINFIADVHSIDTNNPEREKHLQAVAFFDSEHFPTITFESTRMERTDEESYKLHGNLMIKGIGKSIVIDVEHGGIVEKDRFGNKKAGFTINTKINRHDFGVGPVNPGLGDEIKLYSSIQIVKQI